MTVPNVTITWCRGNAKCKWCEQPISIGTPMVRVFFWNRGNEDSRKWNRQYCYHFPDCYSKQGMDYLNRNPYVPKPRKQRTLLSVENKRKRFLLIRKFNELSQRRGKIKDDYPDSLLLEANLTKRMVDIMLEVATVGGVPEAWAGKI